MKRAKGALLALLLACVWPMTAQALQVFEYEFIGEAHNVNVANPQSGTLAGNVTVTLADGGDGFYSGDALLGLDLYAHVSGVVPGLIGDTYRVTSWSGLPDAVVERRGGGIVSMSAYQSGTFLTASIAEGFVQIIDWSGGYRSDGSDVYLSGTARLVPVSPVPEPETYALLLAGLGALALRRRRHRSSSD